MMNKTARMIGGPCLLVAALIAARLVFPNKTNFIIEISIFTIYVMGCNLLYGYLGMVSFGQPFYLSIGAYATAIYLAYLGNNLLVAVLVALIVGTLVGIILGPSFVRLRGDYFALVNAAICAIGMFTFFLFCHAGSSRGSLLVSLYGAVGPGGFVSRGKGQ
jgi:branched-chain amino acid transport system permease protein